MRTKMRTKMRTPGFWRKLVFRRHRVVEAKPELGEPAQNLPTQSASPQLFEEEACNPDTARQEGESLGSIRELWDVAYLKLGEEDGLLVSDFEKRLSGDVGAGLTSVLRPEVYRREMMDGIVRRKMEEINKTTWKLRFGTTEVQVKDMALPILCIIDRTNAYMNSALSSNPSASLAWGCVSLLLPLILNPSTQVSSLTDGLEYVSNLLTQSTMWESLYIQRYESTEAGPRDSLGSPTHRGYKSAMEGLYQKILKFQVSAYCYYSKNEAFRLGLDMLKWHDWDLLLGDVRRQEDAFTTVRAIWKDKVYDEECLAVEKRHREAMVRWDSFGVDVSEIRRAVQDVQTKASYKELIDWLCDIDPSQNHNAALKQHGGGTGDWLVKNSEQFKTWKEKPGSFLWLHGKAGSGKSILTSTVIGHLRDEHHHNPTTGLAYFYFSFSDPKKQTLDGMLASLIQQLCSRRPAIPREVEDLRIFMDRRQRPDTKTLTAALLASFHGFSSVHVVLDALDECPVLNNGRKAVLETICQIVSTDTANLHVICTSRKERDIDLTISQLLSQPYKGSIDLMDAIKTLEGDIRLYIDSTFDSPDFASWPGPVKDEAREALVEKADGMFQYVSLQFNTLRNLSSLAEIRQALLDLPTGLDTTYERMLQAIEPRFQSQVANSLRWLALSRKPLTLDALAEIFVLRPGCTPVYRESDKLFVSEDVLKYLSGLVVVNRTDSNTVVRLAHFSVKEYLMSDRIGQGPSLCFSFNEVNGHLHIAELCIARQLQYCDTIKPGPPTSDLRSYATFYWPRHLEMVPRHLWPVRIVDLARKALTMRSDSLCEMISQRAGIDDYMNMSGDGDHGFTLSSILPLRPYWFTGKFGLVQLTDLLLSSHRYLTPEDHNGLLQVAAFGECIDLVHTMLDKGADVNALGPLADSALHAAAQEDNMAVLDLLLERGASVDASRGKQGTALQVASGSGNLRAIKTLIQHGFDVNFVTYDGGNVLTSATFSGNLDAVRCILDSGADINGAAGKFGSALHVAPRAWGSHNLITDLVERGADVNAHSDLFGSPLHVASAMYNVYDETKLLIRSGAKVNARGGKYDTVLQAACTSVRGYNIRIAKLLLEYGSEINATGGYYETALQAACAQEEGRELVLFLLERGADPNIQGGFYGNALQAACRHATLDTVRLLLDQGLDVNTPGGEYGNALQAALVRDGYRAIISRLIVVRLLLNRGADANQKGGRYGTALQAAAFYSGRDRTEAVRLLLEHGAEVNTEGGEYGTALQAACASGDSEVARLLLRHGANIHLSGGLYGSVWHAAAASLGGGHDTILTELLDRGLDVNDTQGGRRAPALQAALEQKEWENGSRKARIRLLLARDANPNIGVGQYGFPLQAACANDHEDNPAELLLSECPDIDVNAQGGLFGSALQAAAYVSRPSTVKVLLEKGADMDIRGGKYRTALNAAVFKGFWDNVEVLLAAGAKPDCHLMSEPDEGWLNQVLESDGQGAVERYRKFWEVEKNASLEG